MAKASGKNEAADRHAKTQLLTPEGKPFKVQHSWNTNDEYEIELRRVRASMESLEISPSPAEGPSPFHSYCVTGGNGRYTVELRSATARSNTCTCQDFRKNFLGTCKHIEAILQRLPQGAGSSPFHEIYMERSPYRARLQSPQAPKPRVSAMLDMFFRKNGELREGFDIPRLLAALDSLPEAIRSSIRISDEVRQAAEDTQEKRRMAKLREIAAARLKQGNGTLPFLKGRLYDYQQEGALHLAFTGRAILADDMGLGKTVQAVTASAMMREMLGVRRVLVVSPSSLKQEWNDQIAKFTDLSGESVYGNRPQRLAFYRQTGAFFVLMNYEQVVRDAADIMELLKPDLLILDEAQRIKNWTTQTARTLKAMATPYVFVLTGTPLENRIDDIYSIAEIVDPAIFGSLFRFNRRYYKFDSSGKVNGMKNLDELHAKLQPIMLRRRKADVSLDLPPRNDRNLFVGMTQEQRKRYSEEEYRLLIILNIMKKRPLTQEEFKRMQMHLASMRMLCDSCYIMDPEVKDSPKLDEVMQELHQYLENEPGRKIIMFSEWVRMLDLLKERLDEEGISYVEHTGAIPPRKRAELLQKFRNGSEINLLLCSEAGGVGLNLQQASVVFNLDLPWNPAKLEQRIARSWRNKQKHDVDVVNFIAENTIEHKMLATIKFKSGLADLVLDGSGDACRYEDTNAKDALIQRLKELVSAPLPSARPTLAEKIGKSKAALSRVMSAPGRNGDVLVGIGTATSEELGALAENATPAVVISPETLEMLRHLAGLGVISFDENAMKCLYDSGSGNAKDEPDPETEKRIKAARQMLEKADRPLQMARILVSNGFEDGAADAIWKASDFIERALFARLYGDEEPMGELDSEAFSKLLKDAGLDALSSKFLELCHERLNEHEKSLVQQCENTIGAVKAFIDRR